MYGKKIKFVQIGTLKPNYYKGILIRAQIGVHEHIAARIASFLPKGSKIMDLGCGQGALALRLKDMGYQLFCVDKDPEDFQCHGNIDFEALNFDDPSAVEAFKQRYNDSFDLVMGVEVIEHVENHWDYVRLIKSLVKPEGHLLISTPNISAWRSRMVFLFTGELPGFSDIDAEGYGHISPISKWALSWILRQENLSDIKFDAGGYLPMICLTKNFKMMFMSFFNLLIYPFMRGQKNGFCLTVLAKKVK